MLSKADAIERATAAGATRDEIEDEAVKYVDKVGTTPFNNMIRALNMMTYRNTREEWTRLAAALHARTLKAQLSRPRNRK